MPFEIINWNIDPNRLWYVRIFDDGSDLRVELYLSEADAQAQTNRQAYSIGYPFGSSVEVSLAADPGATVEITRHQETDEWHLIVSGADGDAIKIFAVKPFVDLDDISHPIYRNPFLVTRRAIAEIDLHTHVAKERYIDLGIHLPEVEPGQILSITSARRGLTNDLCQIGEHVITGDPNRLVSRVAASKYVGVKR